MWFWKWFSPRQGWQWIHQTLQAFSSMVGRSGATSHHRSRVVCFMTEYIYTHVVIEEKVAMVIIKRLACRDSEKHTMILAVFCTQSTRKQWKTVVKGKSLTNPKSFFSCPPCFGRQLSDSKQTRLSSVVGFFWHDPITFRSVAWVEVEKVF